MDNNELREYIEKQLKEIENIFYLPVCFCLNNNSSEIVVVNVKIKNSYSFMKYENEVKKGNNFKKTIYFYNFGNLNSEIKKTFMELCIKNDAFVLNIPDRFLDKDAFIKIPVKVFDIVKDNLN